MEILREDHFADLHQQGRLQDRLAAMHASFSRRLPGLDRIGIALYDEPLRQVRTFLASPAEDNPLNNYHIPLQDAESLAQTGTGRQVRIVNDLELFSAGKGEHTRKIRELGMRSSYTQPIYAQQQLRGFVFINSRQPGFFVEEILDQVSLFAHLLVQMVLNHQATLDTLVAALRVTGKLMHYKDPETGSHLERMAHFSRLIASELVAKGLYPLDDEQIDHIFRFAPLHDIGKFGIPDDILLKPGRLDREEWSVMKTHAGIGRDIVEQLVASFGCSDLPDLEILRHITELHHEMIDGSGYPYGLKGDKVPLAARIISVSDIFDALTSKRPYKQPWSNSDALAELQRMADKNLLDHDCVAALASRTPEVSEVQRLFAEA